MKRRRELCRCRDNITARDYEKEKNKYNLTENLVGIDMSDIEQPSPQGRFITYCIICPDCKGEIISKKLLSGPNASAEEVIRLAIAEILAKFDVSYRAAGIIVKTQLVKYHRGPYIDYINGLINQQA